MASTYSSRLRIELIGTGEQSGVWGVTTNTNLGTLIEESIAGLASVSMTDANYTLTAVNGATDESRQAILVISGTLTANRNVICPSQEKVYIIKNSTTGGFSITLKTSSGTGITVSNGNTAFVYCDGTNVYNAINQFDSSVSFPGTVSITGTASIAGNTTITADTSLNGAVVINDAGADKDFRVEGDTDTHLIYTDASTDRVAVGTSSPAAKFDLAGNASQNVVVVSASAIDCSTGNYFTKTATGALTWTFTNVPASRAFALVLELTNGGTGTQTWPAAVKWPGGIAPTLTTSGVDVLGFITDDGGTTWRGVQVMKDSK